MKKKRATLLIRLLIVSLLILCAAESRANIPAVVLKQKRAVVTIYINDKDGNRVATGSGFIVDQNGVIATNYHVASKWLEPGNTILFKMENGAFYPGEDILFDKDNDIALVKVSGKELPTVKLAKDYKPKQGDDIVVIGSPFGLETTVSDGIISSVRGKEGIIQITAPISPGSSGSPVLNSKGEVIGVATFLFEGGQNLNFAVSAKHVQKLLDKSKQRNSSFSKQKKDFFDEAVAETDLISSYLIGNSYFEQKKFEDAILAYGDFIKKSPSHEKVRDAVLKQGLSFLKLGDKETAKVLFIKVIEKYPDSEEATNARRENFDISEIEARGIYPDFDYIVNTYFLPLINKEKTSYNSSIHNEFLKSYNPAEYGYQKGKEAHSIKEKQRWLLISDDLYLDTETLVYFEKSIVKAWVKKKNDSNSKSLFAIDCIKKNA